MTVLNIGFAGSLEIDADVAVLENLQPTERLPQYISGTQWLNLNENDREEYCLKSLAVSMIDSNDLDMEEITIEGPEDEDD